jgi:crossover junction endodeoxyribonuclease RuvC
VAGRPDGVIILGVDPGSRHTGYGAIDTDGRRHRLVEMGVFSPREADALPLRLRHIHSRLSELIGRLRPEVMAVEDVFHARSARAALVLGQVRGVVLLAAAEADLSVCSYPPATVKLQVTGHGQAEKSQVAFMVSRLLTLPAQEAGDAADALAVALCQAHCGTGPPALRGSAR